MLDTSTLENEKPLVTPVGYKSGFTFFQESAQKDMLELTPRELGILIGRWPRESGRYIHELWRIGRMKVVYDFFVLPDNYLALPDNYRPEEIREEDVIFDSAIMMKIGGVSSEELRAYITDLSNTSQNAHDRQQFGDEPIYPEAVNERVERVIAAVMELVPQLPE